MKLNTNLYPPGGYQYLEADGTLIKADGWRELYKKIEEYRARLGTNTRDVKQDIADQICRSYPSYCYQPASAEEKSKAGKTPSLKSRVLRWLGVRVQEKKRTPVKYVSVLLARERANICRDCPKQASLKTTCATCVMAMREFRRELLDRQNPDTSLGACSVSGADLPTAVFLDELTTDNPELPAKCWHRRTLK